MIRGVNIKGTPATLWAAVTMHAATHVSHGYQYLITMAIASSAGAQAYSMSAATFCVSQARTRRALLDAHVSYENKKVLVQMSTPGGLITRRPLQAPTPCLHVP